MSQHLVSEPIRENSFWLFTRKYFSSSFTTITSNASTIQIFEIEWKCFMQHYHIAAMFCKQTPYILRVWTEKSVTCFVLNQNTCLKNCSNNLLQGHFCCPCYYLENSFKISQDHVQVFWKHNKGRIICNWLYSIGTPKVFLY